MPGVLSEDAFQRVRRLARLRGFGALLEHMREHGDAWRACVQATLAEQSLPAGWAPAGDPATPQGALGAVLVVQAVRPDRTLAACQRLVAAALGATFLHASEREVDLARGHAAGRGGHHSAVLTAGLH